MSRKLRFSSITTMEHNKISFQDFEVLRELGFGSFGKVQLVKKVTDSKLYAIKSVNMVRLTEKERDSALNEVRLLASINIPYVIRYKGSFFNNDTQSLCLVMEYADGGDLEGKINEKCKKNRDEGFEETFIWKVAFQLFQGLKILHRNNIVHRDIKSANVFFVDGIAKLGDLNVSKVLQNDMCSTQTGTPYYTSPEIWKGQPYGRKCDIWSTGCLLYEMCTLRPPFKAPDFPTLFRKVIVGNYDPIPTHYSHQLRDLIRMCLTVDEELRPNADKILETTILHGMQMNMETFRQEEHNIVLLDPIKCPRVLRFLNKKLPQASTELKQKKTVGFKMNKQIQDYRNDDGYIKQNKARSEKCIILERTLKNSEETLKQLGSNKVRLPPIDKEEPLKFSIKKSRLASKKKITLLSESKANQNRSFKLIAD